MKTFRKLSLLFSFIAVLNPVHGWSQEAIDCRMVADNVRKMIKTSPDHTLTVVEDALVAAPGCVCEIIQSAINASQADGNLVKKIVYTAVKTTQQHAPIIAECAVAAAPQHADAVRAAFAEAFEDAPQSTKKPAQVASTSKPEPQAQPQSKPAPKMQPAPQTAPAYHQPNEIVLAETSSGKQVVEFAPTYAFDAKGVVEFGPEPVEPEEPYYPEDPPYEYPPGITFFGGPSFDLTGLYLVPPVASAPPVILDDPDDKDTEVRSRSVSSPPRRTPQRRNPPKKPKPPVTSRPMSPTGP